MALYTTDGTMLFDVDARKIMFTPQPAYGASVVGNPIIVDGVEMSAGENGNSTASGSCRRSCKCVTTSSRPTRTSSTKRPRSLIDSSSRKT
jgi:hypothetical protein